MKLKNAPGNKNRRQKVALLQREKDRELNKQLLTVLFEDFVKTRKASLRGISEKAQEKAFKAYQKQTKENLKRIEKEISVLQERVDAYAAVR